MAAGEFSADKSGYVLPQKYYDKFFTSFKRDSVSECWEWTGEVKRHGYGRMYIGTNGPLSTRRLYAHHISFYIYTGRWPEKGKVVMHSCDNRRCVNPCHISEATHHDNIVDRHNKGRTRSGISVGTKNGSCKIPPELYEEIRSQYPGLSLAKLAKMYGVSSPTISEIVKRMRYSDRFLTGSKQQT